MSDQNYSPNRWANQLTLLLDQALPKAQRFPVDVETLAKDYSHQVFRDAPVALVKGRDLPGFEGGLYPSPPGREPGWGIIYNSSITSSGRIRFTLAHEFGHYLLHRTRFPDGLECSQEDVLRWDSEYETVEAEANAFASGLLMPLNDFRSQIKERDVPSLDDLGACANRYGVSLTAAVLRWLEYTSRRAVLVVSRDGFIKWARSSKPALKTGLFFRTRGQSPRQVPTGSPASLSLQIFEQNCVVEHDDVWLGQPCREIVLRSDNYDLIFSLLHFDDYERSFDEIEPENFDSYDQFIRNSRN